VKTLPVLPGTGKVIGLDEFYNSEWKMKKDSSKIRFHYVWDDTTNSGFSELAKLIDLNGADPDTLQSAPTDSSLKRFSVYIIVDPDTPKETDRPNVIGKREAEVIERWVKAGGVLVLMANDKGNCEFENLNGLSERFGIRFNEDLHLDVVNNQYDSARIVQFPKHPLFTGVPAVFIKQLSSLTVKAPAKGILSSRGVTVMAEATVGKGKVFAVGDPWLYNEYIDNRRLPKGYENYTAAEAFVRWICSQSEKVR
ncbi:MAG: glycoside hydrolase family 88 protein, partial [Bacteroidetes bacterium]|nr:glycoside hydrolase family 88 protein [Bacteroidota bacterium]